MFNFFFQDKNVWITLIKKLKEDNTLPVVAFTFSRNRCNENASKLKLKLKNLHLTTPLEKFSIRNFIQKSISVLNDQDRQLPQVRL